MGGFRSAIGAFWNSVVDDLRNKIMFRSLNMFNKEMVNTRKIKSYDDFQNFFNENSSTILRSNIEFYSPILWKVLAKEVKIQIVRRIDQEIVKGNPITINLAFSFIEIVNANEYLTLNAKKYKIEPLIDELENNLDVFQIENKCVGEL